jgi:serine protease Do
VTEELAKSFNYEGTAGALVGHIQSGSPAQKAGVQQGDIIVRLRGEAIRDVNELRHRVAALSPGANVELDIFRDGKKRKISVTIGELPGDQEAVIKEEEATSPTHLGMSVETLTPELASRLRTNQTTGVIVTSVQPGSVAARGGIQRGDIILRIGAARIADVAQFQAEIEKVDLAAGVRFVVETQGMERFVFIRAVD